VPDLTNLGKHSITLTTGEPIRSKPYSLPHDMQEEGISEPSRLSDVIFVVVVRKPDGLSRVCIDSRILDKVTVFDLS